MVAAIKKAFPGAKVNMIPGGRGDFLVTADGVRLWDKRKSGAFPEDQEMLAKLR